MVEDEGAGDLQALVERATSRALNHKCWAALLPPDLARFISILEEIQADDPTKINRAEVRRIMVEHGIELSHEAVKRHFRGECRCGK